MSARDRSSSNDRSRRNSKERSSNKYSCRSPLRPRSRRSPPTLADRESRNRSSDWRARSFTSRWDNPNPPSSRYDSYRRKNGKEREESGWNDPKNSTQRPSTSYNVSFGAEPVATRPALFQPQHFAADSTMFPFSGSFMNYAGSSQNIVSSCTNELIDRLIMDEAYRMISNAARPMQPSLFPRPPPHIDHIQQQSRSVVVPERSSTPPSNIPSVAVSEKHANDCISAEQTVETSPSTADLSLSSPSTIGERSRVLLERSAEQVTRKLIGQLATMNKSNLKEMINNPGSKYETALKNHARNKLRAEIRRQLKNINLTANSRPDEEVGNFRPDESIDADKIPDALLQQIGQVLDFEFFNQPDHETEEAGNDHTPIAMDISDTVDEMVSQPETPSVESDHLTNWPKSSHDFVNLLSDSDMDMDTRYTADKAAAKPSLEANVVSRSHGDNNLEISLISQSDTLSTSMLPEVISTGNVVKCTSKNQIQVDATQSAQKVGQKLHNESSSLLSDNQQRIKKDKSLICKQSQNDCGNTAFKNNISSLVTLDANQTKSVQKHNSKKNQIVKKGTISNDESSAIINVNGSETSHLQKVLPNPTQGEALLSHPLCSSTNDANVFSVANIIPHKDNDLRTKSPAAVPILGISTKPVKPSIRNKNCSRGFLHVKPNLASRKRAAQSNAKSSVSTIPSPSHDSELRTKSPTPVAISSLSTKEVTPECNSNLRLWDRHNSRYSWSRNPGRRYNEPMSTDPPRSPVAGLLSANDKRLDARVGDQYVSLGGFSLTYEHQSTDKPMRGKTRHPWIVKPGDIRAYHRNIVPSINGSDTDSISSDQSHLAVDQTVTVISTPIQTSDNMNLNATYSLHSNNPIEAMSDSSNGTRKLSPKTALPIVDAEPLAKEVKNLIKKKLLNRRDKLQSHSPSPKTVTVHASADTLLAKESDKSSSKLDGIQEDQNLQVVENNRRKRQSLSAPVEPLSQPKEEKALPVDGYRITPEQEGKEPVATLTSDPQLPYAVQCSMKQEQDSTRNDYFPNDRCNSPCLSSNETYQQLNDIDSLPPKALDASPRVINELSANDVGDSHNDAETLSNNILIDDDRKPPTRNTAADNQSQENDNNMLEKEGNPKDSNLTPEAEEISSVQPGLVENAHENGPHLRTVPLASLTVNEINIQENTQQKCNGSPMVCVHSWATDQDSHLNHEMVSSQRDTNSPSVPQTTMTVHSKGSVEMDSELPNKMPQELAQSIASSLDGIESIDMETMVLLRRKMDIDTEIMKLDAERMSIDQQLVKKHDERSRQMNRLRMTLFSSLERGNCSSNGTDKKMVDSKDAHFSTICTNLPERSVQLEDTSAGFQDSYPAGSSQERTIRRITRLSENSELMRIFQRRRLLSERSSDDNPMTEDGVLIEQ